MRRMPKLGIFWLGGCGGCDQAILDLHEVLLDIKGEVDLVLWPIAADFKRQDVAAWNDDSVDVILVSGCLRNADNREWAELLRRKAKRVAALGSCACFGGTPGLANFRSRRDILDGVFLNPPTMASRPGTVPFTDKAEHDVHLPEFLQQVHPVSSAIAVDYFIPGCPPPGDLVGSFLLALVDGKLPPLGTFFGSKKAVCDSCRRNGSKPAQMQITSFNRPQDLDVPSDECFLARGVLCLGPATRDGCGSSCLRTNVPCRGCFGPVCHGDDQGARFVAALGSIMEGKDFSSLEQMVASAPDWAGYLYRFTQACSLLGKCNPTISDEDMP